MNEEAKKEGPTTIIGKITKSGVRESNTAWALHTKLCHEGAWSSMNNRLVS